MCVCMILYVCIHPLLFLVSIATELYWRVSQLSAMMSLSRLNLHFPEETNELVLTYRLLKLLSSLDLSCCSYLLYTIRYLWLNMIARYIIRLVCIVCGVRFIILCLFDKHVLLSIHLTEFQ